MKTATLTPHIPEPDVFRTEERARTAPTIEGSWEAFKFICADFLRAADTATSDELQAGAKCVGLAYLGIQWDDKNPLHSIHRAAGAPSLMRIVTRKVIEREHELEQAVDVADAPSRCAP